MSPRLMTEAPTAAPPPLTRPVLFNNRASDTGGFLPGRRLLHRSRHVRGRDTNAVTGIDQPYEIAFEGDKTDGPEWRMVNADGPPPSDTPPSTEKQEGADKKATRPTPRTPTSRPRTPTTTAAST